MIKISLQKELLDNLRTQLLVAGYKKETVDYLLKNLDDLEIVEISVRAGTAKTIVAISPDYIQNIYTKSE